MSEQDWIYIGTPSVINPRQMANYHPMTTASLHKTVSLTPGQGYELKRVRLPWMPERAYVVLREDMSQWYKAMCTPELRDFCLRVAELFPQYEFVLDMTYYSMGYDARNVYYRMNVTLPGYPYTIGSITGQHGVYTVESTHVPNKSLRKTDSTLEGAVRKAKKFLQPMPVDMAGKYTYADRPAYNVKRRGGLSGEESWLAPRVRIELGYSNWHEGMAEINHMVASGYVPLRPQLRELVEQGPARYERYKEIKQHLDQRPNVVFCLLDNSGPAPVVHTVRVRMQEDEILGARIIPVADVPDWMAQRIAVLQLSEDNFVDGVGMRVDDGIFWVEEV